MSFPRYEKYRTSGAGWLGEVPACWRVVRADAVLQHVRELARTSSFQGRTVFHYSIPSIQETGDGAYEDGDTIASDKISLSGEELLVSKLNPRKGVVLVSRAREVPLVCSTEFVPMRAVGCDLRFAYWLYASEPIRARISSVVQSVTRSHQRANPSEILRQWLPMPPYQEQRTIARFLDRETQKIDALIAEQQRLIEVLTEKRQAVISAVIDAGDSDESVRLGHLADLLPGFAFPSERFSFEEGGIRLLRGVNVAVGSCRWEETVYWIDDVDDRVKAYLLEYGDVVLGMDRPWITEGTRVARVSDVDVPSLLVQRVLRLRPRTGVSSRFVELALASPAFRAFLEADMTGVSVPHISEKQVATFHVPALQTVEQTRRTAEASAALERIDNLIAACHRAIALLLERRVALISAAITGKIDVRNLVDAEAIAA